MSCSIHLAASPRSAIAFAAVLLIASLGAHAQVSPSAPRPFVEEIRQQERERALREQQERSVDALQKPPQKVDDKRLPKENAPCFRIDHLVLSGERAADFQWILSAADGPASDDSPLSRCLGTAGINVVLSRLQQALIARGWVTTRVLAAPQDLTQGSLTLSLVPGRIAAIRFADDASAKSWLPTLRNAIPARAGDLLNLRDIEQGLENLKRLGAAIGEMAAEAYGRKFDTTQFAAMISGIAVAIAGGDANQINQGSQAGKHYK